MFTLKKKKTFNKKKEGGIHSEVRFRLLKKKTKKKKKKQETFEFYKKINK